MDELFHPYPKIPTEPRRWGLDEAGYRALRGCMWVVTEKVHGANLCLVGDGRDVRVAKRKAFLEPGEDFYGHEEALEGVLEPFLALSQRLCDGRASRRIYVYGELFGGSYPHPDVAQRLETAAVQTGVHYSPGIVFMAFDLALQEGGDLPRFVAYERSLALFEEHGIFAALPMLVGSYEQASAFPLGFSSTIPARLGLPALGSSNRAEGVVIKPFDVAYLPAPRGEPSALRPVLKRKVADFEEDGRYRRARPGPCGGVMGEARIAMRELLTANRWDNAVTKVGPLRGGREANRRRQALALFVEDVLAELDARGVLSALPMALRARLGEELAVAAEALVRSLGAGAARHKRGG